MFRKSDNITVRLNWTTSDNSFIRYDSDKQEIKNSDNGEAEKKVKNFFFDVTKDIEIIK